MLIRVHSLLSCLVMAMVAFCVLWTAAPSAALACPNHSLVGPADPEAATAKPVIAASRTDVLLTDDLSSARRLTDPPVRITCPTAMDGPWAGQCCCDDTMRVAVTPQEPDIASTGARSQSKIAIALMVDAKCATHQLLQRRTPLHFGSDIQPERSAVLAATHRLRI